MKKLFLFFFALVVSIGTARADKTIYFNPNMWDTEGTTEYFAAYVWNDTQNEWIDLTSTVTVDGNTCYKIVITGDYTKILFTRAGSAEIAHSWSNDKWNQTVDLNLSDNKKYTVSNWGGSGEYWKSGAEKSTVTISENAVVSYSATFATGLDWNPIDAYVWKQSGPEYLGNWPGTPMTATDETFTIDGVAKTVYGINILTTNADAPTNIVFNNGIGGDKGVAQTADLVFTDGKFYVLPTAKPTDPTIPEVRVIPVFSKTYDKELTESNNGWGGGPNPKYTSFDFPVISNEHKVAHVNGTAINGRASATLNSKYSILYVALWPKTATSCKIWDDNKYADATIKTGLVPGQWNYVEVENVNFSTNYIGIELYNGETPETEFYMDHFYFAKPDNGDPTAPTFDTHALKSTNCVSATLTLQATDNNSETIIYKVINITTSSVYKTTGASGTAIDFTVPSLAASTEYTFSVVAIDENGNESAPEVINATTDAYPAIPVSDKLAANVKTIYGQFGTATGLNKNTGTDFNEMSRTVVKYNNNNALFSLPADPEFDVSDMDYIHFDILSDVETPVALFIENRTEKWKGKDVDGGLTSGAWNSFDIPVSFFINDCGQSMTKVINLALIKSVADKTNHEGFGDFSKPYPTLYIANVFFWKETPAKTVTFKNSIGWDNVYAYVADADWHAISAAWPGDEITSTLSWSTTSDDAKYVIFTDGTTQTANLTFTDGGEYDYGYYVVGSMNEWAKTDGYAMARNTYCTSNVEYKLGRQALKTTDMFKVALWNGVTLSAYYPNGSDNAYGQNGEITANDTYNIFFRPNHDGEPDWFEKYIWTGTVGDLEDLGTDPTTGAHVLDGTWNADDFAALDNNLKANSYDLTGVEGITPTLNVINKTANPYCMFITKSPGQVNRNEVVWNASENRYDGYAFTFEESAVSTAPFDINTDIAPIHVNNPALIRNLASAGKYVTLTTPFNKAIPENDKAYTMTATSSASGVNITFTEAATLSANTPYLYYANAAVIALTTPGVVTLDWNAQTVAETDASFVANYRNITADGTENIYVLPGIVEESGIKFYKAGNSATGEKATIRPFRAYITVPAASPARINVVFNDATGIHAATTEQLESIFNIYSIDGKLVRQNTESKIGLEKGIYIINGKKVVIK